MPYPAKFETCLYRNADDTEALRDTIQDAYYNNGLEILLAGESMH